MKLRLGLIVRERDTWVSLSPEKSSSNGFINGLDSMASLDNIPVVSVFRAICF